MKSRRKFLLMMTASLVAMATIVVPVLADELFGLIIKVDASSKKVTVLEKGTDKEVEVTTTDDTEYVTPKGARKIDLDKVAKKLEEVKEKGKKGIPVQVTHEKGVASKITVAAKKKEAPKADN